MQINTDEIKFCSIKNIIFDFGGVLIDLDFEKSLDALGKLADANGHDLFVKNRKLFDDYEMGKIITENFLWHIQNLCKNVPDAPELLAAWNAMILGWTKEKLDFLENIKSQYNIYLLSNTNELHIQYVHRMTKSKWKIPDFEKQFFKKVYYSHLLGMRKPNADIFEYVLRDAGLDPSETLFIDDNADNIATAEGLGLQVRLHERNAGIEI